MKCLNPMAKAKNNSPSLRLAVNAHCYMCMGGSDKDLRTQNSVVSLIKGCKSSVCPLLEIRPYTRLKKQINKHKQEEYR